MMLEAPRQTDLDMRLIAPHTGEFTLKERGPTALLPYVRKRLVSTYRQYVPSSLQRRVDRTRNELRTRRQDLVSIIIPIYDVESYLAECLDSVIGQTYRHLEIIVVDDGSPDGSYGIARTYANSDGRIRIIRQPNRGLGAARNVGVAEAHGRYLCFADSDDSLPLDALSKMVNSLHATGSDFAVGPPARVQSGRRMYSGWINEVHAEYRERVTLDQFPDILKNVFSWAKLFQADFFRRVVGPFPEGIRYEDQEPTARAYVAGTFDILTSPVYYWRIRDDGTSITQQKSDPYDLRDRLLVKKRVAGVISNADIKIREAWLAKAIGFDLRAYFEEVPRTDAAFFEQLRRGVQALADRLTPDAWHLVPIIDRILVIAVLARSPEDVARALARRDSYGWFVPTEVRHDGIYLDRSYLDELQIAPADNELRLGPADLRIITRGTALWWHGTILHLEGYAYITNLTYSINSSETKVDVVSEDGARVPLTVDRFSNDRIDHETKDAWNSHRESGFSVEIDPAELPVDRSEPWHVEVAVISCGVTRSAVLRVGDIRGIVGARPVAAATGASRWIAGFEEHDALRIRRVNADGLRVRGLQVDDPAVIITVDDPAAKTLRLTCRSRRLVVEIDGVQKGPTQVDFTVTLPEVTRSRAARIEHIWSMRIFSDASTAQHLTYRGSADDLLRDAPEHARIRPVMTRAGTLRIAQNRWWAVADHVQIDHRALWMTGRISAPGSAEVRGRMVSEADVIVSDVARTDISDGSFTVRFPFNESGRTPTIRHGYSVRLSVQLDGHRQERWLKVSEALQHRLPSDSDALCYGVTLTRTKQATALWVRFRAPYAPNERGRLAQQKLHQHFRTPAAAGGGLTPHLRNAVLFESFNGRNASDSVLAIFQELAKRDLGLELYWTVTDLNTPVPGGATPLLIHTRDWMDVLHNARYLVNNNNFPFYYRKRTGQTYIQTWHGTPLKRIGNDVPGANLSLSYRQLMKREAQYWDVLLAQNNFAAKTLVDAFGFTGRTLILGYPRNDVLMSANAEFLRKQARSNLGLSEDATVALYAPTWRDNVSVSTGYALVSHLDFDAAREALGSSSVILLRGHANTAHQCVSIKQNIDVTRHPDVNDLILASDILITDYSSLMFDYAVTGKPMLFLTPDLEQYRHVTRGFYLDLMDIAPGPICMNNEELADALADLEKTKIRYTERYARFVQTYIPRDDGMAACRAVDAIFAACTSPAESAAKDQRGG
jgi:CDP-glycerol glycerophosphotransferase